MAWIAGWFSICMLCIYQPFMEIWMGKELMLSDFNMMLFCIYFYAINMNNIRNQYIIGTGIWWKLKYSNIAEAFGNVILNLVLGKLFGITGIIVATIITIFVFNFLWRTVVLFKIYFSGMSLGEFLRNHFYWIICVAVSAVITWKVCNMVHVGAIMQVIINGIICVMVPNVILLILFWRTRQFQNAKLFVLNMIKR